MTKIRDILRGDKILLAAHCGDKKKYPQNVMEAFVSAIDFGADMIETDIRMSGDGELVLIHDTNLIKTCGVDRDVTEMTLEEIKSVKQEGKYGIPTVRELMELIKDKDILMNWEIKVWPQPMDDNMLLVSDKLVALIEEYGLAERSMISCFNNPVLDHIRKKHGMRYVLSSMGLGRCRRTNDSTEIPLEELVDVACMYADQSPASPIGHADVFEYALSHGVIPQVCIADNEEDYRWAIAHGCKIFVSNDIYEADKILKKLRVR